MNSSTEHHKLMDLELDRIDLVTEGANQPARILIHKFDVDATLSDKPVETPDVQPQEVAKQMAEDVKDAVDTVAKADFEAVQKQLDDITKALYDAEVAKAEAEDRVAKMERDAKQAEFVAKARQFENIGKADELGALLLAANESFSPEQYQALERLFKAANAQLEKGDLFAQFSQPDAEAESFEDRLTAAAKAKVDAGQAKTIEIAKLQVLNENPALRAEYKG